MQGHNPILNLNIFIFKTYRQMQSFLNINLPGHPIFLFAKYCISKSGPSICWLLSVQEGVWVLLQDCRFQPA